uniref:Uncharacterized protein n=1 Tax=Podospora anserina (strain S / ATCC MYA-4624 / DSM 980 / FGSC 10383) TaxID=515849 RepID=A0A090CKS3_PODAN|nr:Putative protein of unknown function [Podospora anserina S mat+]
MPEDWRIQQYTEALKPYIESAEEFHRAQSNPQTTMVPQDVYAELSRRISGSGSRMMWVEGPDSPGNPFLSQAALKAVDGVMNAGIPCISYFCKSRYSFAGSGRSGSKSALSHRDAAVVCLLYSIIRQLAWVLPREGFKAGKNLDGDQFAKLNGTLHSLPTALNIIKALLEYTPPVISWVIDGLQFTGDKESMGKLWNLITLLREHMQDSRRVSKTLFTTDGRNQVLVRGTTARERVDALGLVRARGGKAFPGAVYM